MQRRNLSTTILSAGVDPMSHAAQAWSTAVQTGMLQALSTVAFSMQTSLSMESRPTTQPVRMFGQMEAKEQ